MLELYNREVAKVDETLYSLACRLYMYVKKYNGCIVNEVRFHTKDHDARRRSQNSGIVVEGNHKDEIIDFYGVLTYIID